MSKFQPPIGEPPAVQYFGVERLQVDRSYQRSAESAASQRLIDAIASKWDWRLCTPLLVSSRDGGLYIIDGQHRWEAAKRRGDIPFLPCALGNYNDASAEAALFVAANRHRVAVNRFDMWRAAIAAGDEATITIERLVAEAGLSVARSVNSNSLQPGELLCTKGLYSSLRKYGEQRLSAALTQMGEAFKGQLLTNGGVIFAAVMDTFVAPSEDFDPDRFQEALAASPAEEWGTHPGLNGIKGGAVRGRKLRELIFEVYAMLEDDSQAEAA